MLRPVFQFYIYHAFGHNDHHKCLLVSVNRNSGISRECFPVMIVLLNNVDRILESGFTWNSKAIGRENWKRKTVNITGINKWMKNQLPAKQCITKHLTIGWINSWCQDVFLNWNHFWIKICIAKFCKWSWIIQFVGYIQCGLIPCAWASWSGWKIHRLTLHPIH